MKKKGPLLTVNDVHGAWAILPTPAKPGASDWRMTDTVDYDEAARAVEALIQSGVQAIMGLGTLGECATLTWEEKKKFVATVVEVNRGRVPLFFGTTSLNTRDTITQTRAFQDLGVDGIMLGLPMWCAADVSVAVQFFKDVTAGAPDMAICAYANTEAFRFNFPPPFWQQVSELPQVITSKYLSLAMLTTDVRLSKRRIRFLPIDMDYYAAARIDPEFMTAFWTSAAVCGPAPVIALRDEVAKAKKTGDWVRAERVSAEMTKANAGIFPMGSFQMFSQYNIGLEKERMNAAGWMKAGPFRPPYHLVPAPFLAAARATGERWAELHKQYSQPSGQQGA